MCVCVVCPPKQSFPFPTGIDNGVLDQVSPNHNSQASTTTTTTTQQQQKTENHEESNQEGPETTIAQSSCETTDPETSRDRAAQHRGGELESNETWDRNVVRQALATGLSRTLSDRATTRARHFDKGANPKETACASNAVLGIVPGVAISIV